MPCVRRAIRGHNQHCVLCARARAKMRLRAEVANKLNISEQRVQLMLGGSGGGSEFRLQRTMYDHLQLEKHFNEPQSRNANHQTKSVCNIFHRMRRGPGKSRMSYGQLTCCIITDEPRERGRWRECVRHWLEEESAAQYFCSGRERLPAREKILSCVRKLRNITLHFMCAEGVVLFL